MQLIKLRAASEGSAGELRKGSKLEGGERPNQMALFKTRMFMVALEDPTFDFGPAATAKITPYLTQSRKCEFSFPSGKSIRVELDDVEPEVFQVLGSWDKALFVFNDELECSYLGMSETDEPMFLFSAVIDPADAAEVVAAPAVVVDGGVVAAGPVLVASVPAFTAGFEVDGSSEEDNSGGIYISHDGARVPLASVPGGAALAAGFHDVGSDSGADENSEAGSDESSLGVPDASVLGASLVQDAEDPSLVEAAEEQDDGN